jgi:Uri superfamily endonuclease
MNVQPGVYQLHLRLPKTARVKVGKRGAFLFPAGRYIYTGSALGGLENRLARHQRQNKRLHWHIDYFLRYARIERIVTLPTRQRLECMLNREALAQPGAQVVVRGFGSSDCGCSAHLVFLGAREPGGSAGWMETSVERTGKSYESRTQSPSHQAGQVGPGR